MAVRLYTYLVDAHTRLIGHEHPDTLATRNSLARARGEAGHPPRAVARAFAELLPDYERVYGVSHPDTIKTQAYLLFWRQEAASWRSRLSRFLTPR
ncbi:hypothetical protein ACFVRU_41170 [Streptomyces sp. NPDC057927]